MSAILTSYLVIVLFQFFGVCARVLKHIGDIRKENPSLTPMQVWKLILHKDWDTLMGSGLVLLIQLAIHGVMDMAGVARSGWWSEWWFDMASASVLGYGGQDVMFKWLGTAKDKAMSLAGGSKSTTVIKTETPQEKKLKP